MSNGVNKYSIFIASSIVVIAGATIYLSHGLSVRPQYKAIAVQKTNLVQGVLANGTVSAAQDLDLSFQSSGTVRGVNVKVGDQVHAGQILAQLDGKSARASLDQAAAAVATAQANYQKVLNGATGAQTDVSRAAVTSAQTALDNANANFASAKAQQDTAVQNALNALLNTSLSAISGSNNDIVTATISGTYTGTQQGTYQISLYNSGSGTKFQTQGLETVSGDVKTQPVPLGTKGLNIQFSGTPLASDTWTVNIPNTFSSSYVTNNNAYQAALQTENQTLVTAQSAIDTAKSALAQAQANLQLTQSAARPEDVAAAKAQLSTAEASLEMAQNNYSNTTITAPIDGLISAVNAKIGQTAAPGTAEISMISNGKFEVDVYLSEAALGKIKVNDQAQISLDAYGADVNFPAQVSAVDPSASTINNVSAYKVTLQFINADDRIKSGMGANVAITDQTHSAVLAVPASALFSQNDSELVLKNTGGKITTQPVQTGITGLNNYVEITNGLNEGDEVIYFGK